MKRPTSPADGTSHTESELIPQPRRGQERNCLLGPRQQKYLSSDGPKSSRDTKRRRPSPSPGRPKKTGNPTQKADIFHSKEDFLSSTMVHKGKIKAPPSTTMSEDGDISPVPPSYKSTIVEPTLLDVPSRKNREKIPQADSLFSGKSKFSVPKERPKPTIDLDEAWKNIKMEQDEKYADEFRENLLLMRCWDIWRQGYRWIIVSDGFLNEVFNFI